MHRPATPPGRQHSCSLFPISLQQISQSVQIRSTNQSNNHQSYPPSSLVPPPPCDITSGCCSFTGPWTVTRSSLRMLRRVAAFCRPLRPVLLLVSRSPVVGVPGLRWMWRDVPFACQRRPIIGVLRMCPLHVHPPPPPRDEGSPPFDDGPPGLGGNDGSPHPRGGTHTTPQEPEFWYTQRKFFFGACGACDFLLISYCSWAK